jgi:hypothetical protein
MIHQPSWLRGRVRVLTLLSMVLLAGFGVSAQSNPQELLLVKHIPLPQAHSVATDVRWAGANSVYVSWDRDGVAEVGLDGGRLHSLVPATKALGGIEHYTHLAVTPSILLVASQSWTVAWRPLQAKPGGQFQLQTREVPYTESIDVSGDRVLLLGTARLEKVFMPKGDVAWIGSLAAKMEDFKPLLYDQAGAGAPVFFNCATYPLGAARFLPGGSFVVAPGFQDGIHLYQADGMETRVWSHDQIGVDTHSDCARMTKEENERFRTEPGWLQWLNSHHVMDDILPLPQGPGVLVRSWGSGGAHWKLKVLGNNGIKTYDVPIAGQRPGDRLHGDVRNGRIVLLLSDSGVFWSSKPANLPAEIFLMAAPTGREEGF